MERTQPDHTARRDCRGAVCIRAVRLPRMAPPPRPCASEDAPRRGDIEPARDDQVLCHRCAALPGSGPRRCWHGALPGRRGQLLWNRSLGDFAKPDFAHLASPTRNFLDRGILRRGRTVPGPIDWGHEPRAQDAVGKRAVRCARASRRRKPGRRIRRSASMVRAGFGAGSATRDGNISISDAPGR